MSSKIRTIWIVNKYAMPPQYESRLRAIKFAYYLTEFGYKVILFGSSVMHNMDLNIIEDNSKYMRRKYGKIDFNKGVIRYASDRFLEIELVIR